MSKNNFHSYALREIFTHFNSSETGLSKKEAMQRLSTYGYNQLPNAKKTSLAKKFFAQFNDFMIIILIIAAVISFVASVIEGNADFIDPLIIMVIIFFNAIIGLIQETKAEHSLDALKKLSAPYANVWRDNILNVIPSKELVPGDIVILETGNLVPADIRLINCTNLKIDESALTGESFPVSKNHLLCLNENTPLADHKNMVYSSTLVTNGHGKGIVVATGLNTQ